MVNGSTLCVYVCTVIIVHASVKKDPATGLSTTTSQLQYTAGKQDATSKFACVVKHVTGPDQISAPENFSIHCKCTPAYTKLPSSFILKCSVSSFFFFFLLVKNGLMSIILDF